MNNKSTSQSSARAPPGSPRIARRRRAGAARRPDRRRRVRHDVRPRRLHAEQAADRRGRSRACGRALRRLRRASRRRGRASTAREVMARVQARARPLRRLRAAKASSASRKPTASAATRASSTTTRSSVDDAHAHHARSASSSRPARAPTYPAAFAKLGDRLIVNDDVFDWTDLPRVGRGVRAGRDRPRARPGAAPAGRARRGARARRPGRARSAIPEIRAYAIEHVRRANSCWTPTPHIVGMERDGDASAIRRTRRRRRRACTEHFDYVLAATGRAPNVGRPRAREHHARPRRVRRAGVRSRRRCRP